MNKILQNNKPQSALGHSLARAAKHVDAAAIARAAGNKPQRVIRLKSYPPGGDWLSANANLRPLFESVSAMQDVFCQTIPDTLRICPTCAERLIANSAKCDICDILAVLEQQERDDRRFRAKLAIFGFWLVATVLIYHCIQVADAS